MWLAPDRSEVAAALADAFFAGGWDEPGLIRRGRRALGRRRWVDRVAAIVLAAYREPPGGRELARFVARTLERLDDDGALPREAPPIRHRFLPEPAMGPLRWPVPPIESTPALAAFLDLHPGELQWLADVRGWERQPGPERLRNYSYRWLPRRHGPPRLIECPKRHLKELQRRVLHQILDLVPPHETAHGFRRGHSALTHARRHVGQAVVLRFDLEDFFASIPAARIYGLFRGAGYPEPVAHALTALCTNSVPAPVLAPLRESRLERRLACPHLPQGAPASPALANLCAHGLDRRLSALAARSGAVYSRYADDLVVSGDRRLLTHARGLRATVAAIVRDEGFRLNERKSGLTTRAGRQQVTGIVVNERPNATRREFDLLKATLHEAAVHGPARANRTGRPEFRARLLGRIAWVEQLNPDRGARLRRRFADIDWKGGTA